MSFTALPNFISIEIELDGFELLEESFLGSGQQKAARPATHLGQADYLV